MPAAARTSEEQHELWGAATEALQQGLPVRHPTGGRRRLRGDGAVNQLRGDPHCLLIPSELHRRPQSPLVCRYGRARVIDDRVGPTTQSQHHHQLRGRRLLVDTVAQPVEHLQRRMHAPQTQRRMHLLEFLAQLWSDCVETNPVHSQGGGVPAPTRRRQRSQRLPGVQEKVTVGVHRLTTEGHKQRVVVMHTGETSVERRLRLHPTDPRIAARFERLMLQRLAVLLHAGIEPPERLGRKA